MLEKPENFAVSPDAVIHSEQVEADALSDVLQAIRLHGGEVSRVRWGENAEHQTYPSGMRMVYMVESGTVRLSLGDDERVELAAGDMAVLARGGAHHVGASKAAGWVSGEFLVEPLVADPLLGVLPAAIVIRGDDERMKWLPFSLNLMLEEITRPGPGSRVMLSRLLDLLFIRALRAWAASSDRVEPGWLTAAMDPVLAPALTAIHRSPQRDWSVAELAKLAAVSRSAFATRFAELLGQPPGQYVLRQRLEHAAHLLRSTSEPVGRIAGTVGYQSEAAFSRAFTRAHGQSPRAWRTTHARTDTAQPRTYR